MKMREMLARRASEDFVGRTDEMDVLLDTLERDSPIVVHIHGIGGIGKTSLLDAVAHRARARGATVVRLDCRSVEPSERGFLHELGAAVGGELDTAEDAAERLRQLGARVLLALDTYEVYRMMDTFGCARCLCPPCTTTCAYCSLGEKRRSRPGTSRLAGKDCSRASAWGRSTNRRRGICSCRRA